MSADSNRTTKKQTKSKETQTKSDESTRIVANLKQLGRPTTELRLLDGNPRKADVEAVKRSLVAFGQRKPIVANKDGQIIAGNHTYQAAMELGWTEIAVVYVDDDPATARAFALADNRTSDLGSYDEELLAAMLAQTLEEKPDLLTATGYQADEIERLLEQINGTPNVNLLGDPDEIPEPTSEITLPGDLWQLGEHRLLCGDATRQDDYNRLLDGIGLVDCVWTDPPYNVNYTGGTSEKLTIKNDNMNDETFRSFMTSAFLAMKNNMKSGAAIYVSYADNKGADFRSAFADAGFELRQILIWAKDRFVLSRQDYNWQHEPIMYGWKDGAAHTWNGPFNLSTFLDDQPDWSTWKKEQLLNLLQELAKNTTVIREQRPHRNAEHPTSKPVNLITRLITNNTKAGQLILDPFAGSGSTLIAAHITGRVAMTMELDATYCDVICARYQKLTGEKPVNKRTGKAVDFQS